MFELVGRLTPRETSRREHARGGDQPEAGEKRPETRRVGHVYLNATAKLAGPLVKRRPKAGGPEADTRKTEACECLGVLLCVEEWRPDQLEGPRCAPSFR